jgi:hypothetical protein
MRSLSRLGGISRSVLSSPILPKPKTGLRKSYPLFARISESLMRSSDSSNSLLRTIFHPG